MYRYGILRRDEHSFTFPSIATTSQNQLPATDSAIDIRNAKKIVIQVDRSATTFASDSFDLNVISRPEDATTYDTEPFFQITVIASGSVISSTCPTGPAYIKLRADNNSTSEKASANVVVQVVG